ncbi:DNA cytosine methyltransferase [Roseibium sp.]|uniref:DNA cytosine methyltransferase n=1 Tax=Roseibium sp. TaxID=1936156 RepID=UPI003B518BDB
MLKLVDFFSGCGGFSRGALNAGFEVSVAYDNDPILCSSYARNFPNSKHVLADVAKLTANDVLRDANGPIDGVFGGPPCQGFSSIGKRSPHDPRRQLLGHFFRLVRELRPKFFIMENVVGLSQGAAAEVLERAMQMVSADYDISGPWILDAADYGAATRRPRLFVLGFLSELNVGFESGDLDFYLSEAATVRDAINDLVELSMIGTDLAEDTWRISPAVEPSNYAEQLRSPDLVCTGNLRTKHSERVIERFRGVSPGKMDKVGRHHRLSWSGQCPTLRAGTGSDKGSFQSVRPLHPNEPRVITVREAARLQGFPDSHYFHPTIWHSFRMIGNSVSPIMAEALFEAVRKKMEKNVNLSEHAA